VLLDRVLAEAWRRDSPLHGEAHWLAVATTGLDLAAETGADPQIVSFTNTAPTDCTRDQSYTVTYNWQVLNATMVTVEIDGEASSRTFSPTDSLTLQYICNDWPHTLWITATGADDRQASDVNVVSPNPVSATPSPSN